MDDIINIKINGKDITCKKGQTILAVAKENGIDIPNMCNSEKVKTYGACGICVVEAKGIGKLLRACSSFVSDGMEIETETERVNKVRKVTLELMLSDHEGDCRPPCAKACPAGTDCQGYVGLIANGKFDEANTLIKDKIPLPASIGRVCPHPCEKKCRRAAIDDAVQIAFLKRFVADRNLELSANGAYVPEIGEATGKRVAVVGGGPAGLSAAYTLRRKGHNVTIYDAMPKMGGMLRYGIPEYRLPKAVLDAECEAIRGMGVTFVNNTKVGTGADVTMTELKDKFDAVIVCVGLWTSSMMRIPGEDAKGVFGGIDFLRSVALHEKPEIGEKVAVVGGGNTAMDACRTAVRCGAKEVYTFYRRTRAEMPASEVEIEEAEEEGVIFKFLCNPSEIISENGAVKQIKAQKMVLGEPDASGRRSPVALEGEFEIIDVDSVIMAIGQRFRPAGLEEFEVTKKGTIAIDANTHMTPVAGIFACGDVAYMGPDKIAITAIADAAKTAISVDNYLTGRIPTFEELRTYKLYSERDLTKEQVRELHPEKTPLQKIVMSHDAPEGRKTNFTEYMHGFTAEEAMNEASKCLECGCMDYYECKLINYANRYNAQPARLAGSKHKKNPADANEFIIRDNAKCVLCGLCVRACEEVTGNTALGLVGRGFDTFVSPEMGLQLSKSKCTQCGLCVALCPTGALCEKSALKKPVPLPQTITETTCRMCENHCAVKAVSYGKALVKLEPADGTFNICHLGKFAFAGEDKNFIVADDGIKAEVAKLLASAEADVTLDFVNPVFAISAVHTEAEAKEIISAIKDKYPNAAFISANYGKALSGKEKDNADACMKQNGNAVKDTTAYGFTYSAETANVFTSIDVANKASVIVSFGDDIVFDDRNISLIKLPSVFKTL